ncbi:hypothetical protein ABI59_13685 [Acidobacteria bacterium Mor1]|nr:hypothetical protein ABI59_13685 [Acidobacteria bacterium Mor1]
MGRRAILVVLIATLVLAGAVSATWSATFTVDSVTDGAAAARAGIQPGDRIVSLDGRNRWTSADWLYVEDEAAFVRPVDYILERDGETFQVSLPIGPHGWEVSTDGEDESCFAWHRNMKEILASGGTEGLLAGATEEVDGVDRYPWNALAARFEAEAHAASARPADARAAFQRALEIAEPVEPLRAASILARWASFEVVQANVMQARNLALRASDLRRAAAPDSLLAVRSEGELAEIAWWSGDVAGHRERASKAVAWAEQVGPETLEHARALVRLGISDWAYGDIVSSVTHLERAVAIAEQQAPGSTVHAHALNNLARPVVIMGDLLRARELTRQALAIREKVVRGSLDHAWSHNNLGNFELWMGNYRASREHYLEAWKIRRRRAPGTPSEAYSMMNLADLTVQLGDLQGGREYIERGLDIITGVLPGTPDEALCLRTLGEIDLYQGKHTPAIERLERALSIQSSLVDANGELIFIHLSLGRAFLESGELDEALQHLRRAEAMHDPARGLGITETLGISRMQQAEIARRRGNLERARELNLAALEIYENWEGALVRAEVLHQLGHLATAENESAEALEYFRAAVDEITAADRRIGGQWARMYASRKSAEIHHSLIGALIERERAAEALVALEGSRARGMMAYLADRSIDWRTIVGDSMDALDTLRARRRVISEQMMRSHEGTDRNTIQAWRAELATLHAEEDAIADRIKGARPEIAAVRYPTPLGSEEIAAAIPEGTLLLAFSVGRQSTHVLGAAPGPEGGLAVEAHTLPGGHDDLIHRVEILRGLITPTYAQQNSDAWFQGSRKLSQQLLGPLAGPIREARRLVFMLDGPLNLLPLSLFLDDAGEPLVAARPVHSVPSIETYRRMKSERGESPDLRWVGVGAPELDPAGRVDEEALAPNSRFRTRGRRLLPLPGAKTELEAIRNLVGRGGTKLYVGKSASESQVRSWDEHASIVHFASHGLVDDRLPLQSALVLAARDGAPHDGFLQAWEILDDVRLPADLVVLSACDTGGGEIVTGEGLLGLSQSFLLGGARSVLVSLWPISDESAPELMKQFYRRLIEGLPKDEALRQAQLELRRSGRYAHPYHWAGYRLIGDERGVPAVEGRGSGFLDRGWISAGLGLGALLLVIAIFHLLRRNR